jgi:MFS transporter, PPP family, 3-phenylpropionic acid transporter
MTETKKAEHQGLRFGISYFLFFSIYGIASPYLQILLRKIGYTPGAVGIFLGLFEFVGIAGPLILARKADSSGRFNPFLFSSGIAVIAGLAVIVSLRSPAATVVSLGLISLGLKTPVPVLDASLLKVIETRTALGKKAPNYGFLRALGSVGFVIVTIVIQIIPGFDSSQPEMIALCIGFLTVAYLVGLVWLPETGTGSRREKKPVLNFSWMDSTFVIGLCVIALGRLAMAPVGSFFSLFMLESLEWHAIGAMSALAAITEIPMIMLSWRFMRKRSPMQLIGLASIAIVARLLIYALFPSRAGVVVGQLLHSLCYGLFQPAAVVFINLKTPPLERTTGMALLLGFGMGLPAFLGSMIGGVLVEALGYRWLFALFSVFAAVSYILYRANKEALVSVR